MWNLPKPDLNDSIDDLKKIVGHPKTFEDKHRPSVETLYHQYDAQKGMVTKNQHEAVEEKARDAIYGAYKQTSRNAIHGPIKQAILAASNKCPMCAVGNANTLDHFFEKSKYKALSMMRQNMVPMCRDCNSFREYNKVEPSDFIHAYYDILPTDVQWLKVRITYASGAISAIFYPDNSVLTDLILFHKISKTIDGIEFNATIGKELHSFMSSTLSGNVGSDMALRILIMDKAAGHQRNPAFGLNHWKTVLLTELASNTTLTRAHLQLYL